MGISVLSSPPLITISSTKSLMVKHSFFSDQKSLTFSTISAYPHLKFPPMRAPASEGFDGISMIKVTVSECLLIKMPQVMVLMDEGVHFPIRLILDQDDVFGSFGSKEDDGISRPRYMGSTRSAPVVDESQRWGERSSPSVSRTVSSPQGESTPTLSGSWRLNNTFRAPSVQRQNLNSEIQIANGSVENGAGKTRTNESGREDLMGQDPALSVNNTRLDVDMRPEVDTQVEGTEETELISRGEENLLVEIEDNIGKTQDKEGTADSVHGISSRGLSKSPRLGGASSVEEEREAMQDLVNSSVVEEFASDDSGDESEHAMEEDFEPVFVERPAQVTEFIANKMVELDEILHRAAVNAAKSDSLINKNQRKIGRRSIRRRRRAALLLQSEG